MSSHGSVQGLHVLVVAVGERPLVAPSVPLERQHEVMMALRLVPIDVEDFLADDCIKHHHPPSTNFAIASRAMRLRSAAFVYLCTSVSVAWPVIEAIWLAL